MISQLDPMHYITPTLGEEQVIDIELDRNTQLLSETAVTAPPSWDDEDQQLSHSTVDEGTEEHAHEPGTHIVKSGMQHY